MNMYLTYAIKKLDQTVAMLEDSSQKNEICKWMTEINEYLDEDADIVVEKMDRIKALTNSELLKEWDSYHYFVMVYQSFSSDDVTRLQMLRNELYERGMKEEMEKLIEGCKTPHYDEYDQ